MNLSTFPALIGQGSYASFLSGVNFCILCFICLRYSICIIISNFISDSSFVQLGL